ncbi:MAG TPA: HEAT repeat domain-containing protein [Thermogutta sp.]|nr:HEAT repeat domain-containing protein [Thermogutta sp.]
MSYDDRAIVTGDEKEDTVALKPVSAGAEGQGGKPMDPHAEAARDTAQSTAPAVRHLRVDGAKHPPGGLSQNLMWLIFSRIGVPLLMLAGAVLLLQKARLWFRPPLEMPQIIQDIRSDGAARWRAVAQIGAIMADGRYPEVRSDRELAMAMSDAFREELQRPLLSVSDLSVVSRKYLCFLLWQMDDESVILALCEGATWWGISMPQPGSPVRCAALEGLCEMARRLGPEVLRQSPAVLPALRQAARDPIDPVRANAALALGLHGGPSGCETLEGLLNDPSRNVRYSAAIGLSTAGSDKGVLTLKEFFECEEVERLVATGNTESIVAGRTCRLLLLSLESIEVLMNTQPEAQVESLRPAINRFCQSQLPPHVKEVAFRVRRKMQERTGE